MGSNEKLQFVHKNHKVMDRDRSQHVFYTGDNVFILPEGLPKDEEVSLCDLWIAKIDSIRAEASHNAWMRVMWYYDPQEIQARVPSFRSQYCASRERLLSNHYDIVPTISCNGSANIIRFQEDDPLQDVVEEEGFFYRLNFDHKKPRRQRKRPPLTPFVLSCVCKTAYGPDLHVMHWCCKCKRWFHKGCLKAAKGAPGRPERSTITVHNNTELRFPLDIELWKPSKAHQDMLEKVERVAQHPIVRGLEYGVVGNCRYVAKARQLLQEMLSTGGSFSPPCGWEKLIGISDDQALRPVETWFACPVCQNII